MSGLILKGQGLFSESWDEISKLPEDVRASEIEEYMGWLEDKVYEWGDTEDWHTEHHVQDGLYTRTIHVPANRLLIGMTHKKASWTLFSSGAASVLTQAGCSYMKAPLVFFSSPGFRRILITHSPIIWSSVFSVNGNTLEEIEDEVYNLEN